MHIVTNFCYLCLANSIDLTSVDTEDDDGLFIKDKLKFCVPETVGVNHEITKCVCIKCISNLKNFFTFKRACIQSTATLSEYFKNLPFINEPNKQLTLSIGTTNYQNTKTQVLLVKITNMRTGGNNELNKVLVPTEIKSIQKSVNTNAIKKYTIILPSAKNKKTLENEVQINGNTDVKRILLPTNVKNKTFENTNTQTVDNSELMRLLLPKNKNILKNMVQTVGNSATKPSVLSTDKNTQKNIANVVQTVGNSVKVKVQNRHIEIMQTADINECGPIPSLPISDNTEDDDPLFIDETVISNEIKNEVMELEDIENQDGRQKICEDIVVKEEIWVKNEMEYEETENQDEEHIIGENLVLNKDILVKSKTTSEVIYFEDLIQKNDIDAVKIKDVSVKNEIPTETEFEDTYSLSAAQIQQNSSELEIVIKEDLEDLPTTDDNNQESENLTSNIDENNVDKTKIKKSRERSNNRRYICFECNRIFKELHNLRVHEKVHSGLKDHECKICQKRFSQKCNLRVHQKIHSGEKRFECSFCKKKFLQKSHLQLHEKIHTEEKNHECGICKKKFVQKINLLYHEKTHKGVFDYECKYCDKKFHRKEYYLRHFKRHKFSYECKACNVYFETEVNFLAHLKEHNLVIDQQGTFQETNELSVH